MDKEWKNKLWYGDNLEVLRMKDKDGDVFPSNYVDLIYLDPPFNSNASYSVLFGEKDGSMSHAQMEAFNDTWSWDEKSSLTYKNLVEHGDSLATLLVSLHEVFHLQQGKGNDMFAYLVMMSARLRELYRILKPTGSLYLHCDPTASHYIKLVLDAIFGFENCRNEIVWRNTGYNKAVKTFGTIHQIIFFYTKSSDYIFNQIKTPYSKQYVEEFFTSQDNHGRFQKEVLTGPGVRNGDSGQEWHGYNPTDRKRHWQPASYLYNKYKEKTGEDLAMYPLLKRLDKLLDVGLIYCSGKEKSEPRYKYYLEDAPGVPLQDIWAFQPGTKGCIYNDDKISIDEDVKWLSSVGAERLGYPTQKPEGLLTRIIKASSNEGDLVLDPFCGCGTTIAVAERLKRRWIGIDITWLSVDLMERRLKNSFGTNLSPYEIHGLPKDYKSAEELAVKDPYQFQFWAISMIEDAKPYKDGVKGADGGVDGYITFWDEGEKPKKIVIQIKGGKHISRPHIQQLSGVMQTQNAVMGIYVCLDEPKKTMIQEAAEAGFYTSPFSGKSYPKIQILTIKDMMEHGKQPEYPKGVVKDNFYAKAPKKEKIKEKDSTLFD